MITIVESQRTDGCNTIGDFNCRQSGAVIEGPSSQDGQWYIELYDALPILICIGNHRSIKARNVIQIYRLPVRGSIPNLIIGLALLDGFVRLVHIDNLAAFGIQQFVKLLVPGQVQGFHRVALAVQVPKVRNHTGIQCFETVALAVQCLQQRVGRYVQLGNLVVAAVQTHQQGVLLHIQGSELAAPLLHSAHHQRMQRHQLDLTNGTDVVRMNVNHLDLLQLGVGNLPVLVVVVVHHQILLELGILDLGLILSLQFELIRNTAVTGTVLVVFHIGHNVVGAFTHLTQGKGECLAVGIQRSGIALLSLDALALVAGAPHKTHILHAAAAIILDGGHQIIVVLDGHVRHGCHGGLRRLLRKGGRIHLAVPVGNEGSQEVGPVGLEVAYAQGEAIGSNFLGYQGGVCATVLEQRLRYLHTIGGDVGHWAEAATDHHRHAGHGGLVHRQGGRIRQVHR